ncbi:MAG: universal stress protein [Solirubrobacterales bacterium]|nr:universal stress protein [Solirubrobacterales bacterium]
MFDHVLVGIGDATRAGPALDLARRVVAPGGRLTLGHVWIRGDGVIAMAAGTPHPATAGRELLERILLRSDLGSRCGVAVRDALALGRGLRELAAGVRCDLLVLGSSWPTRPGAGVHLSREVRAALHGAPCAVAVTPAGPLPGDTPHVLGVAFEDGPAGWTALRTAQALAPRLGADVHALAVIDPQPGSWMAVDVAMTEVAEQVTEAERTRLRTLLEPETPAPPRIVVGAPVPALREWSGELGLLVLGARSTGPVRRLLPGSTADALVCDAHCAVLVVPERRPAHAKRAADAAGASATA